MRDTRWAVYGTASVSRDGKLTQGYIFRAFPTEELANEWIKRQDYYEKGMRSVFLKVVEEEYSYRTFQYEAKD